MPVKSKQRMTNSDNGKSSKQKKIIIKTRGVIFF